MNKILIAFLVSAFTFSTFAADIDNQTDGAELGTNETTQAQDQSKNSNKNTTHSDTKKRTHAPKKVKPTKSGSTTGSENNPLQPTDSEPAPGAAQ
jgi:hypothetical protein